MEVAAKCSYSFQPPHRDQLSNTKDCLAWQMYVGTYAKLVDTEQTTTTQTANSKWFGSLFGSSGFTVSNDDEDDDDDYDDIAGFLCVFRHACAKRESTQKHICPGRMHIVCALREGEDWHAFRARLVWSQGKNMC